MKLKDVTKYGRLSSNEQKIMIAYTYKLNIVSTIANNYMACMV